MSDVVVNLADVRRGIAAPQPVVHLAGVLLPAETRADLEFVGPPVRSSLLDGSYNADLIEAMADALRVGDRVLVIGSGLGVVTTLIAKTGLAQRVVAIEADPRLVEYQERVHAMNGVEGVECLTGIATRGRSGPVPYFVRRDFRESSLTPDAGPCREVVVVPFVDLDLVVEEEGITLIVASAPQVALDLPTETELGTVERLLVSSGGAEPACPAGLVRLLRQRAVG